MKNFDQDGRIKSFLQESVRIAGNRNNLLYTNIAGELKLLLKNYCNCEDFERQNNGSAE